MAEKTARKLVGYLCKDKWGYIKVHKKYDQELGMWVIVIVNTYVQEMYEFHCVTRDTVRAMRALVRMREW